VRKEAVRFLKEEPLFSVTRK